MAETRSPSCDSRVKANCAFRRMPFLVKENSTNHLPHYMSIQGEDILKGLIVIQEYCSLISMNDLQSLVGIKITHTSNSISSLRSFLSFLSKSE